MGTISQELLEGLARMPKEMAAGIAEPKHTAEPEHTAEPKYTAEQIGWRFTLGTAILVGAYIAWPLIPVVMATDLDPGFKAALSGFLGATPFLSKFVAIAVMGKPAYDFLKRNVYVRLRRRFSRYSAK